YGVVLPALYGECGIRLGRLRSDPSPGPARKLPGRRWRALNYRSDLIERHPEYVVEHEREPLRRGKRLEDHQQGQPDRVGHDYLPLRVSAGCGAGDGIRNPLTGELLPTRLP